MSGPSASGTLSRITQASRCRWERSRDHQSPHSPSGTRMLLVERQHLLALALSNQMQCRGRRPLVLLHR